MPKARFPSWWVTLGPDTASNLRQVFADVMNELPMSQRELARRLGVDPSTVTRWAAGEAAPAAEKMLEAIEEVREYVKPLFKRASLAQEMIQQVIEADEAEFGSQVEQDAKGRVQELLEEWKEADPPPSN